MPPRTTLPRFTVPSRSPISPAPDTTDQSRSDAVEPQGVSRRRVMAGALGSHLSPAAGMAPLGMANSPGDLATEPQPDDAADAELLDHCALVHALDDEEITGDDRRWSDALLRVSALRPTSRAGLHAKTRLVLLMLPFGSARSCPDWASPDERLIWSLLRDVLALSNPGEP